MSNPHRETAVQGTCASHEAYSQISRWAWPAQNVAKYFPFKNQHIQYRLRKSLLVVKQKKHLRKILV